MNNETMTHNAYEFFVFFPIILIAVLLAVIPASIAYKKGRSFFGYWLFGCLFFLPALITALLIKPKTQDLEKIEK